MPMERLMEAARIGDIDTLYEFLRLDPFLLESIELSRVCLYPCANCCIKEA